MQPPPLNPPPGLWEFVAELLDARWAITTLIAIYAAFLSTFQVFIKDWWLHRPRIKMILFKSVAVGDGINEELLSVNVINKGYQPRRFADAVSFQIKELLDRGEDVLLLVTQPKFNSKLPLMLAPSESYTAYFPRRLAIDSAREHGFRTRVHVRVVVQDGTNARYDSNWIALDIGD